jgi:peptidoglycan DL-endopeptidase CwlO
MKHSIVGLLLTGFTLIGVPAHVSATPSTSRPAAMSVTAAADIAVAAALAQVGVPYIYATAEPGVGFDCSGLVGYAWRTAGVELPRVTFDQRTATVHIDATDVLPGDLVFSNSVGHVGLYLGDSMMVHAPRTGELVSVTHVFPGSEYRRVKPTVVTPRTLPAPL